MLNNNILINSNKEMVILGIVISLGFMAYIIISERMGGLGIIVAFLGLVFANHFGFLLLFMMLGKLKNGFAP